MKRPRSTPEYHAGASAFSGSCDVQTLCIECRETYPPYAAHRCKPECTQCAKRCDRVLEVLGLPFCSRTCWREHERIDAPQELTPGSKPL